MKGINSLIFITGFLIITFSCSTESIPVFQLITSTDPVEAGTVTPSSSEHEEGEAVIVTATPNEHWVFNGWGGDFSGSVNPATVMLDSDKHVVAFFIKKEYTLTMQIEGEGTVTEMVVQSKSTDYPFGTQVELTANPESGWVFIEWQGDLEGSENPETIIISGESSITAVFTEIVHPVECEPPFWGTLWVDPNIILPSDPSTFMGMTYEGQDTRQMHDRRYGWITEEPYLFDATFDDGLFIEIQVNPEFGNPDSAKIQAEKYGWYIGQIPTLLRKDVETAWIHKGFEVFGGGNNNLQIHTDYGERKIDAGLIGELFLHEGAHTSLDADHASSAGWLAAQAADNCFISAYARDYPMREDIAESFPLYVAIRYRSGRIPKELIDTIKSAIPNRIAYFDKQGFDMYPIVVD